MCVQGHYPQESQSLKKKGFHRMLPTSTATSFGIYFWSILGLPLCSMFLDLLSFGSSTVIPWILVHDGFVIRPCYQPIISQYWSGLNDFVGHLEFQSPRKRLPRKSQLLLQANVLKRCHPLSLKKMLLPYRKRSCARARRAGSMLLSHHTRSAFSTCLNLRDTRLLTLSSLTGGKVAVKNI